MLVCLHISTCACYSLVKYFVTFLIVVYETFCSTPIRDLSNNPIGVIMAEFTMQVYSLSRVWVWRYRSQLYITPLSWLDLSCVRSFTYSGRLCEFAHTVFNRSAGITHPIGFHGARILMSSTCICAMFCVWYTYRQNLKSTWMCLSNLKHLVCHMFVFNCAELLSIVA